MCHHSGGQGDGADRAVVWDVPASFLQVTIFFTGHPKMEGEGWRQVLAKASGSEWKMMSLGVGRLFLASILA